MTHEFLAVGGAHWDILGTASRPMDLYDDVGGRIRRLIGGVAGPVAMKLGKLGSDVELICYAGHDELGEMLLAKLAEYNVSTTHALRGELPTDVYMGIEAPNGLIAAIADCQSLEARSKDAAEALFAQSTPNTHVVIDGNIHEDTLAQIASENFAYARLTLIPASPGKIDRFRHFIGQKNAKLIVNKREAEILAGAKFDTSQAAADHLFGLGFSGALVSDGANLASFASAAETASATPPEVEVKRFTGAGDTLAAHFLYGQNQGLDAQSALEAALKATSEFISSEDMDA